MVINFSVVIATHNATEHFKLLMKFKRNNTFEAMHKVEKGIGLSMGINCIKSRQVLNILFSLSRHIIILYQYV